ncbi:WblY protein [Vibrio nigripulchritudo MADA3029]|uniref:nucleotidyltransferase family protein n=1 Tax=Vibrio nigripulchritudo TaxID=28173 RepID=UPI0003B2159D|nr:nucleotidyltransferase family protein [Vibrio nigripulchritudo]CCN47628.1 WblY protein [Vibrio nigripulchritudo MADA3020]CCN56549.1 WblY protein [Vibrio nigripulchritudo MADA3021]CCN58827.1 WblY protein [Vibrio nigripulchritudo MADA3029]
MFEALILAGGKGTRLKSVTGDIPKPMVNVNGSPFLYRLMRRLESQGCKRIVLSLGYQSDYIVEKVKADRPVACDVEFVIEKTPLGTGGAIKLASRHIIDDRFLVLNGDTYCEIDYAQFIEYSKDFDLTISGVFVDEVDRYGVLNIDCSYNVVGMNEKSSSGGGVINSGIYVLKKSDIINYHLDSFSFEVDFIPEFKGIFKASVSTDLFIDIGIPRDYIKACSIIK